MAGKSGAEVLREFVVKIGFNVDEQQFRNFGQKFIKIAEGLGEVGAAVTAATAVIDKGVNIMAARFEKLYYAAQNSGTTVRSLQDVEMGAQAIGLEAGKATAMISGMASAMRMQPGLKSIFGAQSGDSTKDFIKNLETLHKMAATGPSGYRLASRYGSMLGIDENTFKQLNDNLPAFKQYYEIRDKMARDAGIDPDKIAAGAKDYGRRQLELKAAIEIFETLVMTRFLPTVERLVVWATKLVQALDRWDTKTHGASTWALGIGAATATTAGPLILLKAIAKALGIGAAGTAAGAGEAAAGGAALGAGLTAALVAAIIALLGGAIAVALDKMGITNTGAGKVADSIQQNVMLPFRQALRQKLGLHDDSHDDENGIRGNNPGNMRRWAQGQETFERKGSGTFVKFNSAIDGLSAMVAALMQKGRAGNSTIADIANAWMGKSDKENPNRAAYIAGVAKSMGIGAATQLNLNDPDTMRRLMHGMIQQEQGKDPYSVAQMNQAIAQRMGQGGNSQALNQKVDIHVNGGKDTAREVASNVADEQRRVFADATRRFVPRTN